MLHLARTAIRHVAASTIGFDDQPVRLVLYLLLPHSGGFLENHATVRYSDCQGYLIRILRNHLNPFCALIRPRQRPKVPLLQLWAGSCLIVPSLEICTWLSNLPILMPYPSRPGQKNSRISLDRCTLLATPSSPNSDPLDTSRSGLTTRIQPRGGPPHRISAYALATLPARFTLPAAHGQETCRPESYRHLSRPSDSGLFSPYRSSAYSLFDLDELVCSCTITAATCCCKLLRLLFTPSTRVQ